MNKLSVIIAGIIMFNMINTYDVSGKNTGNISDQLTLNAENIPANRAIGRDTVVPRAFYVSDVITNINDETNTLGSIYLKVSGGAEPYTYYWYTDEKTSFNRQDYISSLQRIVLPDSMQVPDYNRLADKYLEKVSAEYIDNITKPGIYKCRITDAKGNIQFYEGVINSTVILSNNEGFYFKDNMIIKTDPDKPSFARLDGVFDVENGDKISFRAGQDKLSAVFGFVPVQKDPSDPKEFEHGIFMDYGKIIIIDNGEFIDIGSGFKKGTLVTIASSDNALNYYIEGKLAYTRGVSPGKRLIPAVYVSSVDVAFDQIVVINSPRVYGIVSNSFCGEEFTNSLSVRVLYLNNIRVEWYDSQGGSYTGMEMIDPKIGWYTVIVTGERENFPSNPAYQKTLRLFNGYYAEWMTTELDVTPPNRLSLNETTGNLLKAAVSLNQTTTLRSGSDWANFKIKANPLPYFIVMGIKEEYRLLSNDNLFKSGIGIISNPPNGYIYNSWVVVIHENIEAGMFEFNGADYDIYFEIDRENRKLNLYNLVSNTLNLLVSLDANYFDQKLEIVAGIDQYRRAIKETLTTFCYRTKCHYNVLKRTTDGGYALSAGNILRFKYDEEYNRGIDQNLNYRIYEYDGGTEYQLDNYHTSYGDNRYSFDITTLPAGRMYILEVTNPKNEKRYLKFKRE